MDSIVCQPDCEPFLVGTTRVVVGLFFNSSGKPIDPTTVTLIVRPPASPNTLITLAYPADLTREGEGDYIYNLILSQPGEWRYRWVGTGACAAVIEGTIQVRRSGVVP